MARRYVHRPRTSTRLGHWGRRSCVAVWVYSVVLFWQGLIILIILAHSSCVAASATSAHMVNLLYQKLLELDASRSL